MMGRKQYGCTKMAEFICTRCGKCCISLGRNIRIERSLSPVQHYCRMGISGDIVMVTLPPEHRDLYASGESDPGWCPFLRRGHGDIFTCTVYGSRPGICREFRCRTMTILDREGREVGQVTGRSSLKTSDMALEALWKGLQGSSPEERIRELSRHGYNAEPFS
jgi:Fe-S-cluster containining protein